MSYKATSQTLSTKQCVHFTKRSVYTEGVADTDMPV